MVLFLDDCPLRATKAYQWMDEDMRGNTMWCKTAQEIIFILAEKGYRDLVTTVHLDHDVVCGSAGCR